MTSFPRLSGLVRSYKDFIRVSIPSHLKLLTAFALCVSSLPWCANAELPQPVRVVNVQGLSQPKKLALIVQQGLANREGPRVFLDFGADNRWNDMAYEEKPDKGHLLSWSPGTPESFKARFPTVAQAWQEILEKEKLFRFEQEAWETFLAKNPGNAKGWIVYDSFNDEVALVSTLAGLKDAIPVLHGDFAELSKILPGLPIVFDTRSVPTLPGLTRKVSAHRWMIDNVLDSVEKTGLVSRDKTYNAEAHDTFVDIDQAVQERWLVYNLTHYRDDTADKPNPKMARPEEAKALGEILARYPPFTPVFGWGAVDENTFVRTITEKGLVVICSGVPNNSFFNRWKAEKPELRQRHRPVTPNDIKVEKKVYLTFMVNEGDSVKNALTFQGHGGWLQPERGSVPINWGADPALYERYSGLMEHFYKTATPRDYFFAAAAGWGYVHPNRMTPEQAGRYVEKVNSGLRSSDLDFIDIWWLPRSGLVWEKFAKGLAVRGLTRWHNPEQKVDFKSAAFPVAFSNHYYTLDDPEKFARMLIEDYKDVPGPWFVVVYGGNRHLTPHKVDAVVKALPAGRFKAVLLDEFFAAAVASKDLLQGRVWRPGPNAPKGVAP